MKLFNYWKKSNRKKIISDKISKKSKIKRNDLYKKILIYLSILILITFVLSINFFSDKIVLKEGQISSKDITALQSIKYIDLETTKNIKDLAAKSIQEVYDLNLASIEKVENQVNGIFSKIKQYKKDAIGTLPYENTEMEENDKKEAEYNYYQAKAKELNSDLGLFLDEQVIIDCFSLDELSLNKINRDINLSIRKIMEQGIKEEDLDNSKKQLIREISEISIDHHDALIATEIGTVLILPSLYLNEDETENRRLEAISSVQDVEEIIQKDQIIIRKGEIVSAEDIAILNALGLQNPRFNYFNIIGILMISAICLLLLVFYLNFYNAEIFNDINKLVLLSIICFTAIVVAKLTAQISGYLIPIAYVSMLTSIAIDSRVAIIVTIVLSYLTSLIPGIEISHVLVSVIGGVVAIFSIRKATQRSSLTRAGLMIAAANIICISALGLMENIDYHLILQNNLWGIINGFLAVILTIGILPFLESFFDITSSFKLMELSNPNQPLLKKLIVEAPGTYHHSIVVGNLAETAAEEIEGNSLLARVGALYHDIGKLKRPYFFIENQEAYKNIHDEMEPSLSALVIASHVKEGVDLAKKNKIPKAIVDIITQHHGTGLISYFFHRALKENGSGNDEISEENYRYSGPKPQSKEAGIILLADSLEAATRSLTNPTPTRIKGMVKEIIQKNLENGQMEECDLTLKDLDKIAVSFSRILTSMFHGRIDYPDDDLIKKMKEEKKNGNSNKKSAKNNKSEPEKKAKKHIKNS